MTRDDIPALLNKMRLNGEGVEIGVRFGEYSEHLLHYWICKKLYSIDPWVYIEDHSDGSNVSNEEQEKIYEKAKKTLGQYGSRSDIIRDFSISASKRFKNQSLDFVYIDARHDYKHALEDINLWLPKVRIGGILAGHDFLEGTWANTTFGVKKAVLELFPLGDLTITREHPPSWIYTKR